MHSPLRARRPETGFGWGKNCMCGTVGAADARYDILLLLYTAPYCGTVMVPACCTAIENRPTPSLLLHRAHELTAIVDGAAKLNATRAGWSEPETLCPCLPSNNAEAAGGVDRRVTHAVGATGTSAGVRAIGYSLPPSFTRNLFKCCVMQTTLPKF